MMGKPAEATARTAWSPSTARDGAVELLASLLERVPRTSGWNWLAVPAPVADPEVFVDGAPSGPLALWVPPDDIAVAAVGAAEVLVGSRHDRMQEILERGNALLTTVEAHGVQGAPRPRCLGGFAFQAGDGNRGAWSEFGDARFILPRLAYFRQGADAHLVVVVRGDDPDRARWLALAEDRLRALERVTLDPGSPPTLVEQRDLPRDAWHALVGGAKAAIEGGRLDKVVTARSSDLSFDRPVDPIDVLCRLSTGATECTRFAFRFDQAVFLGASPERLVRRRGLVAETEALAGSIRTSGTESSRTLLASPKERSEHDLVVREITRLLAPLCGQVDIPEGPQTETFRHIQHLRTPIRLTLDAPLHVLRLVDRLHPTPAVGGVPTREALGWITEHEQLDRGWYAGPVGWFDARGDGEFDVALRSGLVAGKLATLYAGSGVVSGSDPESEYAETSLKLAALRTALGLSQ